jgi:hypothetical protein
MNSTLQKLLRDVEKNSNRGPSPDWTNYDFDQLSELIFSTTEVKLSATTLKRIWGKVKYPHAPAVQTLNALARFVGYIDWRDFERKNSEEPATTKDSTETILPLQRKRSKIIPKYVFGVLLIAALMGFTYFGFRQSDQHKINPADYSFSLDKIKMEGVPNSVVFSYDVSKAPTDSNFIVQTWDITRKIKVAKNKSKHSAIYYYPGFFNTKLIIDSTTVKRQDLQISSAGWLGLVETNAVPFYFTKEEIKSQQGVSVTNRMLSKHAIPQQPVSPKVRFFNQRDLGDLTSDNFQFETLLRNLNASVDNTCHQVQVLIQCKDDIIIIPLTDSACVGDLRLAFAGASYTSAHDDLSKFGCDLAEWTKLKIVCYNRHARIFVNDHLAFDVDVPNKPVGIVGVQYRFNGPADIKYSKFWDRSGKLITLD